MSSDRDLAQRWLAERLWHDGLMHVMSPEDLAAAILDTPGVSVESFEAWVPEHINRLSIILPAGVAAHQHTEKINEEKL
jgi:hypothetical protein